MMLAVKTYMMVQLYYFQELQNYSGVSLVKCGVICSTNNCDTWIWSSVDNKCSIGQFGDDKGIERQMYVPVRNGCKYNTN